MIKKVITYVLSAVLLLSVIMTAPVLYATTTSEDYIPSEKSITVNLEESSIIKNLRSQIIYCKYRKTEAHKMAEAARALNHAEDSSVIKIAQAEWASANDKQIEHENKIAKWKERSKENPIATYVWLYLKDLGYNDYICAGIMGNLMAEVGGNTLYLQYWLYGGKIHYGMCQWNINYYPDIKNADLQSQCNFLRDTIEYELNTFGSKYQKSFDYKDFKSLTNCEEAALAFAKSYERCSSAYYKIRQKNAIKAYEYFVD